MAVGDAMLNSFFFYPAILAAGAMASAGARIEYRQPRVPASA
jgi:hypothetical protein